MIKFFYLGPENSFSYLAALLFIKDNSLSGKFDLCSVKSFLDIKDGVESNINSVGILPIENSSASDIYENMEYLFLDTIKIVGEVKIQVQFALLGVSDSKLEDVKEVISQPKALQQCKKFIKEKNLKTHEVSSTSEAINLVLMAKDKSLAAIGSSLNLQKEIKIINENVNDYKKNITRFLIVANKNFNERLSKTYKFASIVRTKHEIGSLNKLLKKISDLDINITKISSKPVPETDMEYEFYIEGKFSENNYELDLKLELKDVSVYVETLGIW